MSAANEDKVFNLDIRDTSSKTSSESESGALKAETIFITNGLDVNVTIQVQGARESTWVNCGNSFVVNAGTSDYATCTDYFPKFQLTAACGSSPTSGTLEAWVIKT
jgi:hypothetical protein